MVQAGSGFDVNTNTAEVTVEIIMEITMEVLMEITIEVFVELVGGTELV